MSAGDAGPVPCKATPTGTRWGVQAEWQAWPIGSVLGSGAYGAAGTGEPLVATQSAAPKPGPGQQAWALEIRNRHSRQRAARLQPHTAPSVHTAPFTARALRRFSQFSNFQDDLKWLLDLTRDR